MPVEAGTTRAAEHLALIDELDERLQRNALGGTESSRKRHVARGKLLPRERVNSLLDPGTAFLELSGLAADGVYDDDVPGPASSPGLVG